MPPAGPPQGFPQGAPQGSPQGAPPSAPPRAPQGFPQYAPQDAPHGSAPQAPPYGAAHPSAPQPGGDAAAKARELVDGEWHRLHPATPLLRGGLALIVVAGILINNFRDTLINLVVPDEFEYGGYDPVSEAFRSGVLGWVLLAILGFIGLSIVGFWLTWRVHRFRITADAVEVQQGLLFRRNRRAPINRIQGVNIVKPWFARLFGACKFEVQQAGNDSNVDLNYLSASVADALRYEILGRASGRSAAERARRAAERGAPRAGASGVVQDFLRPDAEIAHLAPQSLVRLSPAALIGSSILDGTVIAFLVTVVATLTATIVFQIPWILFSTVPIAIALVAGVVRSLGQKLRYSIAATDDGIRLAYGLATTTVEVLPPGRIFSITVSQPLLWRIFGWWKITFTRAGKQSSDGSSGQSQSLVNVLLPVGTERDVRTVLALVLPRLGGHPVVGAGLVGRGEPADGFTVSPPRARAFRWFSRRRNGIAATPDAFLLRRGAIWRSLVIVPQARTQSIAVQQGPIYGMAGLARLVFHVVGAAISPSIGALDARDAMREFEAGRASIRDAMVSDTSEDWGAQHAEAAVPAVAAEPQPARAQWAAPRVQQGPAQGQAQGAAQWPPQGAPQRPPQGAPQGPDVQQWPAQQVPAPPPSPAYPPHPSRGDLRQPPHVPSRAERERPFAPHEPERRQGESPATEGEAQ